jgi:hypothetical protein
VEHHVVSQMTNFEIEIQFFVRGEKKEKSKLMGRLDQVK